MSERGSRGSGRLETPFYQTGHAPCLAPDLDLQYTVQDLVTLLSNLAGKF